MVKLYDGGVYLVNGREIVTDPAALPGNCLLYTSSLFDSVNEQLRNSDNARPRDLLLRRKITRSVISLVEGAGTAQP